MSIITTATGSPKERPPIPEAEKGFQCEVVAHSIGPTGKEIATLRVKYPLIIHAEWCRHRAISRSVASNRAIPTWRIIQMLKEDPFIPIHWGIQQPGMAAMEEADPETRVRATNKWLILRDQAIETALGLTEELNIHKQVANRVMMPFQWVTEVITATEWDNLWGLRIHPAAEPHFQKIATMAYTALQKSHPRKLLAGQWHLPFVDIGEQGSLTILAARSLEVTKRNSVLTYLADICKIKEQLEGLGVPIDPWWIAKGCSAARCARTTLRTHEGKAPTLEGDFSTYLRLMGGQPKHVSPTEHQARAMEEKRACGNFIGWHQHRYDFPDHTILHYNPR